MLLAEGNTDAGVLRHSGVLRADEVKEALRKRTRKPDLISPAIAADMTTEKILRLTSRVSDTKVAPQAGAPSTVVRAC